MAKNGVAIRFEAVHKRFDDLEVLKGMDLEVRWGEVTTILGPSGCGKSVTLRHIIGIEQADRGRVTVIGQDMSSIRKKELKELRKRIGVLFQSAALFDSMNVKENVAFGLRMHTLMSEREIDRRVSVCLDAVRLSGAEQTMPVELSGGMRKRAALARAIAMSPDFILYDEPTTGLDPSTAAVVGDYILKLQNELDVTSVVVTHDLPLARRISDRLALLYNGKTAIQGTPEEIERSGNDVYDLFVQGKI